jgi:hypothetical protein
VNLGKSFPVLGNDEPSAFYLLPAFLHDVGGRIWVGLCKSNSISVRIPNDRLILAVPQTIEIEVDRLTIRVDIVKGVFEHPIF